MINIRDLMDEATLEALGKLNDSGITVGGGQSSNKSGIFNKLFGPQTPSTQTLPSDPTFTSGNLYAQSIAGGQNVPNMIAPGMSYSAASPLGYTQEDIRVRSPGGPGPGPGAGYIPGGSKYRGGRDDYISIGGPGSIGDFGGFENIMYPGGSPTFDESAIPFKGSQYQPLDLSGIQSILDTLKGTFQPDLSGYAKLDEIPQFDINDYRDNITSIARQGIDIPQFDLSTLNLPDFNNFVTRDDLENRPIYDDTALRDQITSIEQRPTFDPTDLQSQISGLQNQFSNIPTYEAPNIDDLIARLDALEKSKFPVLPPVIDDSGKKQKPVKIIGGF